MFFLPLWHSTLQNSSGLLKLNKVQQFQFKTFSQIILEFKT